MNQVARARYGLILSKNEAGGSNTLSRLPLDLFLARFYFKISRIIKNLEDGTKFLYGSSYFPLKEK